MTSELENWLKQFQDVNYSEIVNYFEQFDIEHFYRI